MRQYHRADGADPRRRRREARPHRHRHAVGVRPSDALRSRRRLSAGHHQEAAPQIDHPRAALVPARRHQRPLAARARRHDLGRVGRRRTASSARSMASSGARWPAPDGGAIDQIANVVGGDPPQSRFAPPDRHRLEPGRGRRDGAAALPLPVPVLCRATAGSPASSTSARPTSSWACRSTSPPTRC